MLTNVVMLHMSGRELASQFQKLHSDGKVLFTSGYNDPMALDVNLMERSSWFIPKPFTPTTLALKVREMLEQWMDSVAGRISVTVIAKLRV